MAKLVTYKDGEKKEVDVDPLDVSSIIPHRLVLSESNGNSSDASICVIKDLGRVVVLEHHASLRSRLGVKRQVLHG